MAVCWICLGSQDEAPPPGIRATPSDFSRVCKCLLRAHTQCLVKWITRRQSESESPLLFRSGSQQFYVEKCPQCEAPIYVYYNVSLLRRLTQLAETAVAKVMSISVGSGVIGLAVSGLVASGMVVLGAIGMSVLQEIVPAKLQAMALGANFKGTLDQAVSKDLIPSSRLFLLPLLPVYLQTHRMDFLASSEFFLAAFPFAFFADGKRALGFGSQMRNAQRALLVIGPCRSLYNFIFKIVFNRIYYEWATSSELPVFNGNGISDVESDRRRNENNMLEILDMQMSMLHSPEEVKRVKAQKNKILRKLFFSRWFLIMTVDYSQLFVKHSSLWLFSTFFWPKAAKLVGKYLLKPVPLSFGLSEVNELVRNILGFLVVAVGKDVYNFLVAWLKVREERNLKLVIK